jgi:alpha-L-arabinofuranosidase
MRAPAPRSSSALRAKTEFCASGRCRAGRLRVASGYAARWMIESLEPRTLYSVGSIPTVPSPAAHWTLDEGTGTTAADSSGNGHTATLGAGVTWTAGNVGSGAVSLTGTSTGVVTATGPVVNTAGSFTASAWVDLATVSGYQTVVSIAGTNVAGFFLGLRADTGAFSFARLNSDATGTATIISAPTAPVAGTWYHIVGVDDATAGTLTLYVDGQSEGSTPYTSGWAATGNILIGHGFYGGSQVDFVDGSIDDVQLFSSALSAAQVTALDQPAAYSFDDGTGSTAADVSGHGNTLTLGFGASWAAGVLGSNSLAVNGTATGNATNASPVINTALPFSVSAWVNLSSVSGYQTFVSIDGANASGFYLQLRGDTGEFAFTRLASDSDAALNTHADATSTPSTGVWYNLIGVNDVATGQLLLYVNGVLQSTVAYTGGWQATGATVIGGGKFNGARTNFASGDIDDVHFYDSPLSAADAAFIGTDGNSIVNVATGSSGVTVSPDLFGAFMEDINFGGEGGIYNDEVRNSGFNDSTNALNAWAPVASSGVTDTLASDITTGPTSALTQSGMLSITSGVSSTARAGISNAGYFGVGIAPSISYTVEFYAKSTAGFTGPLTVDLESTTGTVYAVATIPSITSSWAPYTATLTTGVNTPTTATNLFVISTNSTSANGATIWFGATYLYPPSYDNASNHLRIDLMQMLAALKPAIFRVPGGNYLEGDTDATKFEWSNTIGPVQDRPGHYNSAWGYWSTDGMGLDEYLQMAEEVGASPILAVFAGYTLNGSSDTGATLTADVTDAVNELHYVLDPTTTSWGAERAANGHPAPYNVTYVEVGNEDFFSTTYAARYPLFYNAIHAAFPQLQIIATSTSTGGSPYNVVDDHFYETPQWFEANSDYFDNMVRGSNTIFIGEYASNQGTPTNDMESALGDSAWLLGLERNSDLVTMSSYAPLWVNVNGNQWVPDLIGFNNTTAYGSPSYYAQVILANNHGTTVVSDTVNSANGLQVLVTRTGSTYYLTAINTIGTANTTTVNLSGVTSVSPTGTVTSLTASSSSATNSITNPTNIVPVTSSVSGLGPSFSYTFPGYSITVLQFTATVDTPTVATPAAATPAPVTGTTANLSVLGADASGEANLTYTWSATGPAAVNYSANGTNAAKNTVATFAMAGTYTFQVSIVNPAIGAVTVSTVVVTVNQTATMLSVTPTTTVMAVGTNAQFTAGQVDQFGNLMGASAVTWSIISGSGSISPLGVYTAPATGGSATIRATFNGGATASATVTIAAATAWYQANASSGKTLTDSSGNGLNGTLAGGESFTPGVSGNALALTGGNATLPTGIVSSLTNFTIATWVKPTTLANWDRIFDFGTGTTDYMFLTPDAGGTNSLRFAITTSGGGGEQQLNGPTIAAGVWTHIAVTLAGSTGTLYVNGVAVAVNTAMTLDPSSLGNTNQNYLGKSQFTADPALQGSIDDFRIYGAALSAQQVMQLALPGIVVPAAASAVPVTGTSTNLSVQASDVTAGEPALTYTWATTGMPPAAVVFGANGTNAAKNITVTFSKAGTYNFTVTIVNPAASLSTTNSVAVIVNQTLTSIAVTPTSPTVAGGTSSAFSAVGSDQFSNPLSSQPTFTWSTTGGGSLDSSGDFTASQVGGSFTVKAAANGIFGSASVNVVPTIYSVGGTYNVSINGGVEQIAISGGPTYSINIGSLPSLAFNGSGTTLAVNFANGNAIPTGGLNFSPVAGSNSLSIIGTSGNDSVVVNGTTVTFGTAMPITYANLQIITINGGAGVDTFTQSAQPGGGAALTFIPTAVSTLNVNAGTYTIPAPFAGSGFNVYALANLNVANGASVATQTAASHSDRMVLMLGTLLIGSTGKLNLGGNDMIVHNTTLSSITTDITAGFNASGTLWAGNGLASSTAATSKNAALGVELNSNDSGGTLMSSFDNQTVISSDVLVKYTYFGDADLSGKVDSTDYGLIDSGFNSQSGAHPLSGWRNGDFNYDGSINGDDYTLIDNAFNTQGATSLALGSATDLLVAAPQGELAATTATTIERPATSNAHKLFATQPIITIDDNWPFESATSANDWLTPLMTAWEELVSNASAKDLQP